MATVFPGQVREDDLGHRVGDRSRHVTGGHVPVTEGGAPPTEVIGLAGKLVNLGVHWCIFERVFDRFVPSIF